MRMRVQMASAAAAILAATITAHGQVASAPSDLTLRGGQAEAVTYLGRQAVRLTTDAGSGEVFAFLKSEPFQDGTIETDIALKTTTPPGVRMPGFAGIAFRARTDGQHYDMFYLRPGNSISDDQTMRNHSVQYVAAPDNDWYKLRTQWPWVYESWADLEPEHWSHVKIEVHGRMAKLLVDGSDKPGLIVDGLRGEDLQGGVALWGYAGEEAYFANVRVTPEAPKPVTNGGEAAGRWAVEFTSDYGKFKGTMELTRTGDALAGTWTGDFGRNLPVNGTWRNGYVELTFGGIWPEGQKEATARLAGWVDGNAAKGRMSVVGRAMGQWTAVRQK